MRIGVQAGATPAGAGVDNTPRSLLAFEGAAAVAGLGDWLFNEAPVGEGAGAGAEGCDVPTLLAPVPFEHAALHRLAPQVPHIASSVALHLLCLHTPTFIIYHFYL